MGRRKLHKKNRQKYNLVATSDRINLISETKDNIPIISDNSTSCVSKRIEDFQNRTPELVMQEYKKIDYYEGVSPKICARLPKLKLNLDIPENEDVDDVNINKNCTQKENRMIVKDLEKTLSVEKVFNSDIEESIECIKDCEFSKSSMTIKTNSELVDVPTKQLTSLSEYFKIPSSTFNIVSNYCALNNEDDLEEFNSTKPLPNVNKDNTYWDTSLQNLTRVDLPVISDLVMIKTDMLESHVVVVEDSDTQTLLNSQTKSEIYFRQLKNSVTKITKFCNWFSGKFIIWIKKGYKGIRNLISIILATFDPKRLINHEKEQIVAVLKDDNNRILAILANKLSLMSEELQQVRISNEASLLALRNEISNINSENKNLLEVNYTLVRELKDVREKVNEIRLSSTLGLESGVEHVQTITPPLQFRTVLPQVPQPPPPPPPPPPPMPSILPASKLIVLTTPKTKNGSRTSSKTPKRKIPYATRPAITVEDLLKVTLKKAPQNPKDRRNTIPGPRGPAISLDMLRNVKLKSAKRRSLDQHKSPIASRLLKNRSQSNLSLSPIMLGAEGSLRSLLKPIDTSKRVFRKTQSVASNSESDLLKDSSPKKFVSCRSESILI